MRNFAFIVKLASYFAFLMIAIEAVLVMFAPDCGKGDPLYNAALILVMVDASFWGATHCFLPLYKNTLD